MSEGNLFELGDQLLIMEEHNQAIRNRIGHMKAQGFVEKFWAKDGRLWEREQNDPTIQGAMGWIRIAETMRQRIPELQSFASEVKQAGFERAVLAGMGGSSLAPFVLSQTLYEPGEGMPVDVLDSTDPATVLRIEREAPLEKTLFIIASKSGTTAEPKAFDDYFFDRVGKVKAKPGDNFVAITDPGTEMESSAKERGFRRTFLNFADIGGRFSALSYFGLVPAALMQLDLAALLDRAIEIVREDSGGDIDKAPGFVLGAAMGTLATLGINKMTFWTPKELGSVGLWLEQLLAESTGKEAKGILPVAGEEPGTPSEYGKDRVFAYLRSQEHDNTYLDAKIAALRDGGWPIVWINMRDRYDIAREFMRWELATAAAGSVIGINPFDQPNVQESKDVTKKIIAQVEERGELPQETPTLEAEGISIYGQVSGGTLEDAVCNFLDEAKQGDFVALMAYLTETPEMDDALHLLQMHVRDNTCLATTLGYGPRFLHSTGQFHKGGPNVGHFIQFTQDDREDVPLPGRRYTFGTFRNAQAIGDRQTLEKHGRRVISIHLGREPEHAVRILLRILEARPTVAHT